MLVYFGVLSRAREVLQETNYCMPYPTPVFKQHYMLQELGMACNTWFLVVRARNSERCSDGGSGLPARYLVPPGNHKELN